MTKQKNHTLVVDYPTILNSQSLMVIVTLIFPNLHSAKETHHLLDILQTKSSVNFFSSTDHSTSVSLQFQNLLVLGHSNKVNIQIRFLMYFLDSYPIFIFSSKQT